MWKGSIWGAGFQIPFLSFTRCETSSLLPQPGFSSRALGGSRSQKQIGRCRGQIQMPLKPLFILVFQKVKKNKLALFAKSTRTPQVELTTSYPSELGILRTSVSKCNEKRIVRFLPSFPEDLRVFLPLCFLFPFSLGRLSTAILIQLCRSGTTQSNSFSHPEQPGTSFPPPALLWPFGHGHPSRAQFTQEAEDEDTKPHFYSKPGSWWTFRSALLDGDAMHCHLAIRAQ